MADRIVVLREGRVEQVGAPLDLYRHPRNSFVAGFLGAPRMNFLAGHVKGTAGSHVTIASAAGATIGAEVAPGSLREGESVTIGIRPEALAVTPSDDGLAGTVDLVEHLGSLSLVYATLPSGEQVVVEVRGVAVPGIGQTVRLSISDDAKHVFAGDGRSMAPSDRADVRGSA